MQCALRCQDWVLLLSQLFSSAEVAAACAHIRAAYEPLVTEWRKATLAVRDAGYLPPCMLVLQGVDILEKALEQVCVLVCVFCVLCVCFVGTFCVSRCAF